MAHDVLHGSARRAETLCVQMHTKTLSFQATVISNSKGIPQRD